MAKSNSILSSTETNLEEFGLVEISSSTVRRWLVDGVFFIPGLQGKC